MSDLSPQLFYRLLPNDWEIIDSENGIVERGIAIVRAPRRLRPHSIY